jgi:hypothetical protein
MHPYFRTRPLVDARENPRDEDGIADARIANRSMGSTASDCAGGPIKKRFRGTVRSRSQ